MFSSITNFSKFINYWWFRYLMVTELYMVEKWERITIHIIFAVIFSLFWYFNYSVVLSLTGSLLGTSATSSTSMDLLKTAAVNHHQNIVVSS